MKAPRPGPTWQLLVVVGAALVAAGLAACGIALTVKLLPYDVAFLGMTGQQLCDLHACRIVHFMVHDRISFGGSVMAVGLLYVWLAYDPLRRGDRWALRTLLASGLIGFASFLSYLGNGYLDVWHGRATLALLATFVVGMVRTRRFMPPEDDGARAFPPSMPWSLRSRLGAGRALLLATAAGMILAGATITVLGSTTVFVPQDLAFMGLDVDDLRAINPRLVPLIAHDRAGFGGGLVSTGVAMLGIVYCRVREGEDGLWWILLLAGGIGFTAAISIHAWVGYLSFSHLLPALVGALLFAAGMTLLSGPMCGRAR